MVANANEIRKYVVRYHIQPAIREGRSTIEVSMLELEEGLKRGRDRAPYRQAIRAALTTQDFQTQYDAKANEYTSITFTLRQTAEKVLDQPKNMSSPTGISEDSSLGLADLPVHNRETESIEEVIAKLTERIDELTQDEFENLVQEYARAKGFSSVEVSFTMKMEI